MLGQHLLFTACPSIQFFNSFFVIYGKSCRAKGHHSHFIFCDLWDTMPCQRLLLSSLTTFVTYGIPYHTKGHHSHFPSNPYLGKQRICLGVASILRICLFPHSQLTYNQCDQSFWIDIYMVKRLADQQFKAVNLLQLFKKYHSYQSAANSRSIIKVFLKIYFKKLLPQKYIFKIVPSKNIDIYMAFIIQK